MKTTLKKTHREILLFIIIAVTIGFIANLISPNGYQFVSKSSLSRTALVFISAEEAKIKYDASSAIFLDSRDRGEYEKIRVHGALYIPALPESLSMEKLHDALETLNQKKELVIYCNAGSCSIAETLAERLMRLGYKRHLYIMKNGLPEWTAAGYPVEGNDAGE